MAEVLIACDQEERLWHAALRKLQGEAAVKAFVGGFGGAGAAGWFWLLLELES